MGALKRTHVQSAVQVLTLFMKSAVQSGTLTERNFNELRDQCLDLLAQLDKKMDVERAAEKLNEIIASMNKKFTKHVPSAPYPAFVTDDSTAQFRNEILSFEHYLNQQLRTQHLPLTKEKDLFQEATVLWRDVGGTSFSLQRGVSIFSQLVKKLNKQLPEKEHFPLPDEKNYS